MSALLEGEEQLERELAGEKVVAPATGSVVLHIVLGLAIALYYVVGGFLHGSQWGGSTSGGAIRVNLVTSALPLPSDQPINDNVLATERPSAAPEIAQPKPESKTIDMDAIPIPGKHDKAKPQPAPKTAQKQPQPRQDNRAQYGERAGSSLPRAVNGQTTSMGPTSIGEGDFGSRFGWYVDGINRKMALMWNKGEVDQRTPKGARVYITYTIHRDGSPGDVQLDRSSGSPTLDRSCIRAAQRVDTFGNLPGGYTSFTLKVSYYCEY